MTDDTMDKLAGEVLDSFDVLIARRIDQALKLDGRLRDLEAAGQAAARVESLERRASRQAEHLARVEDRLKKLESGR